MNGILCRPVELISSTVGNHIGYFEVTYETFPRVHSLSGHPTKCMTSEDKNALLSANRWPTAAIARVSIHIIALQSFIEQNTLSLVPQEIISVIIFKRLYSPAKLHQEPRRPHKVYCLLWKVWSHETLYLNHHCPRCNEAHPCNS